MEYVQLDERTAVEYVQSLNEMKKVFSDMEKLDVREVGDGNLNYVFKITNSKNSEETVVLKQAVPFVRVVGNSWPLPRERMSYEIMALQKEYELCPKLVPKVYHYNHSMSLVIMQNLKDHTVLRECMNRGEYFPHLAEDVSTFLARTLFYTSDWFLDSKTKKEMVRDSINIDLCKLTEDLIFTEPYFDSERNSYNSELSQEWINFIQNDNDLKVREAELKYDFMTKAEALVHGDLHTGSIMVNDKETYIFDPEFAFFGPIGFDVGLFIGNSLLAYFAHAHRQVLLGNEPYAYRKWIIDMIEETWKKFVNKFDAYWEEHHRKNPELYWGDYSSDEAHAEYRRRNIARIFKETIGFAGSVLIRRILGLAKVSDIVDLDDLKARAKIEEMCLKMGKELVLHRDSYSSINEVLDQAVLISPADQAV